MFFNQVQYKYEVFEEGAASDRYRISNTLYRGQIGRFFSLFFRYRRQACLAGGQACSHAGGRELAGNAKPHAVIAKEEKRKTKQTTKTNKQYWSYIVF